MIRAEGFTWVERKSGEVVISHKGRQATVLRGQVAARFVDEVNDDDCEAAQAKMARLTGNYKRGNERKTRNHPKNR